MKFKLKLSSLLSRMEDRIDHNFKKKLKARTLKVPSPNSRLFITLASALIIMVGSYLAIRYAQGDYRLTRQGVLLESGLLNANSFPTGAQIFIDDELISATDNTLYLEPGTYTVKLVKDGYSPWQKEIIVEKELVTQTNARLFPAAPTLTPLTFTGAENLLPSPDGRKIVYFTNSASVQTKNGLYVLELNNNLLPFQKSSRQIATDVPLYDLGLADFIWSPDSTKLMILTDYKQILIQIDQLNNLQALPNISFKRQQILSEWEEEMYIRERQYLVEFPEEIVQIATQSAKNVYLSPDKKKLLYTATASASLAKGLIPPLPSTSTQPEERNLQIGTIYVYDREEDKNFAVAKETGEQQQFIKGLLADDLFQNKPTSLEASPSAFTKLQATSSAQTAYQFKIYHSSLFINTLQWFDDSNYLLFENDSKIQIIAYDGTNNTTLYSGPFAQKFIYPWPDGDKLIILAKFSSDSPNNLYAIELK